MSELALPFATAQAIYSRQPGFGPEAARRLFKSVTDVRTFVVYCPDPRASGIPAAVAKEFGEIYPGESVDLWLSPMAVLFCQLTIISTNS